MRVWQSIVVVIIIVRHFQSLNSQDSARTPTLLILEQTVPMCSTQRQLFLSIDNPAIAVLFGELCLEFRFSFDCIFTISLVVLLIFLCFIWLFFV